MLHLRLERVFAFAATSFVFVPINALNLTPSKTNIDGIYELAKRQVPNAADAFTFTLTDGDDETFSVKNSQHQAGITVECTSASACARGFYTYDNKIDIPNNSLIQPV